MNSAIKTIEYTIKQLQSEQEIWGGKANCDQGRFDRVAVQIKEHQEALAYLKMKA